MKMCTRCSCCSIVVHEQCAGGCGHDGSHSPEDKEKWSSQELPDYLLRILQEAIEDLENPTPYRLNNALDSLRRLHDDHMGFEPTELRRVQARIVGVAES